MNNMNMGNMKKSNMNMNNMNMGNMNMGNMKPMNPMSSKPSYGQSVPNMQTQPMQNMQNMQKPMQNMQNMQKPMQGTQQPMYPMQTMQPPMQNMQPMAVTSGMMNMPSTVSSPYYTAGFLRQYLGHNMRVEYLLGTNGPLVDRTGRLVDVGASYIVLQPLLSDELLMTDLYSIRFVTIYD